MQRSRTKQDPAEAIWGRAIEPDAPLSPVGDVPGNPGAAVGLSCPPAHADYPLAMNIEPRLAAVEGLATAVGREQGVRAWCARLDCTEAEVRDTVLAIMRLMASSEARRVYH
jgi:hypothetical protein